MRSPVLGEQGQKQSTNVFLGGQLVATQHGESDGLVSWHYADPVVGSRRSYGDSAATEPDPAGVDAGLSVSSVYIPPDDPIPGNKDDLVGGCTMDGGYAPCSLVMKRVNAGVAAGCPGNDCGPRFNPHRDGPGRGGWELPYLTHAGFIYNPIGPSTTPRGMAPPTLGHGRPTNPRPGDRNPYGVGDEGEDVTSMLPIFGGLGSMLGIGPQGPVPRPAPTPTPTPPRNPCAGVKATDLDYWRSWERGRDRVYENSLEHITRRHILLDNSKTDLLTPSRTPIPRQSASKYLFQNGTSLEVAQQAVINLNAAVFENAQANGTFHRASNGNFVMFHTFRVPPIDTKGNVYVGVGYTRRSMLPTNSATLIVNDDCSVVITSHPGLP